MNQGDPITRATRLLERAKELNALQYGDFTLTSGAKSKFYFDGRLLSTDPESLALVSDLVLDVLAIRQLKVFGGPAVGAVPMVGAVVLRSHQRMNDVRGFFVRSEAKEHGMGKLVEGNVWASDRVAVYDDAISTGGSLLDAVGAVQNLPAHVGIAICILDRRQGGTDRLRELNIPIFNILVRTPDDEVEVDYKSIEHWLGWR